MYLHFLKRNVFGQEEYGLVTATHGPHLNPTINTASKQRKLIHGPQKRKPKVHRVNWIDRVEAVVHRAPCRAS
jgi:hypothetical protein